MKTRDALKLGSSLLLMMLVACSPKIISAPEYPQKVMPGELEGVCNQFYIKGERGKRLSWKGAVPVVFTLDESVPTDWIPALENAMAKWNTAAGVKVFELRGYRSGSSRPSHDNQNTIYVARPGAVGEALRSSAPKLNGESTVAYARTWYMKNKIYDADVVFNGITQNFTDSRLHGWSFDIESIAMHELGHVLGLDDNHDTSSSVMYYDGGLPFGLSLRRMDDLSKKLLTCEY